MAGNCGHLIFSPVYKTVGNNKSGKVYAGQIVMLIPATKGGKRCMVIFPEKSESKDVTQKNLEGFPDVAADILNVFIHGGKQAVQKEALIRLLRALGGDVNVEDTTQILEEMNIKEEDEITMCELFDQYTRRGRKEGLSEGIQKGLRALISTCHEMGITFDETVAKVKEKFSLGEEEARKSMQLIGERSLNYTEVHAMRIVQSAGEQPQRYC